MQSNPGIQNTATLAFSGATARPADIRKYVRFGWSFEVIAPLAADTIFKVQAAPPSAGDPCVPGAFVDVEATPICLRPLQAGALATFTIPAGTPVGTVCSGTIPCVPNAFVRLAAVSGDTADIIATLIRQGPMSPIA